MNLAQAEKKYSACKKRSEHLVHVWNSHGPPHSLQHFPWQLLLQEGIPRQHGGHGPEHNNVHLEANGWPPSEVASHLLQQVSEAQAPESPPDNTSLVSPALKKQTLFLAILPGKTLSSSSGDRVACLCGMMLRRAI